MIHQFVCNVIVQVYILNLQLELIYNFEYLYLPQIAHWGKPEVTPNYTATPLVIDRKAEYRKVSVTLSSLKVRKWDQDKNILSGNFTMTGHFADSTGKVFKFKVEDGMFDVTDQAYPLN